MDVIETCKAIWDWVLTSIPMTSLDFWIYCKNCPCERGRGGMCTTVMYITCTLINVYTFLRVCTGLRTHVPACACVQVFVWEKERQKAHQPCNERYKMGRCLPAYELGGCSTEFVNDTKAASSPPSAWTRCLLSSQSTIATDSKQSVRAQEAIWPTHTQARSDLHLFTIECFTAQR